MRAIGSIIRSIRLCDQFMDGCVFIYIFLNFPAVVVVVVHAFHHRSWIFAPPLFLLFLHANMASVYLTLDVDGSSSSRTTATTPVCFSVWLHARFSDSLEGRPSSSSSFLFQPSDLICLSFFAFIPFLLLLLLFLPWQRKWIKRKRRGRKRKAAGGVVDVAFVVPLFCFFLLVSDLSGEFW